MFFKIRFTESLQVPASFSSSKLFDGNVSICTDFPCESSTLVLTSSTNEPIAGRGFGVVQPILGVGGNGVVIMSLSSSSLPDPALPSNIDCLCSV